MKKRTLTDFVQSLALVLGTLGSLTLPMVAYWYWRDLSLSSFVLVCVLCFTFLSQFGRLQKLSFGGMSAELARKVEEANATLQQLEDLTAMTADAHLSTLIGGSFMAGMPEELRYSTATSILDTLDKLELSKQQIAYCTDSWRKGVSIVYCREIGKLLEINKVASVEVRDEWKRMGSFSDWTSPSPAQIRQFILRHKIQIGEEAAALIADYEHFCQSKNGRVPNVEHLIAATKIIA